MKKHFQISEISSFFIQLFITVALLILCGTAISCLMPDNASEIYAKYAPLFAERLRRELHPEPIENLVYTALCLMLVPLVSGVLYASWLAGRKYRERLRQLSGTAWNKLLWTVCILAFSFSLWCFFGRMDFFETIFTSLTAHPGYWLPCAIATLALALAMLKLRLNPKLVRKWWPLAFFPLLLIVIFNRMYYLGWVPPNTYHIEFLIYSVSHAARGQLEWHLYGNYHWMLSPLFTLIKPSIFNFSIVMNIFFLATFMILVFLSSRLIRNYLMLILMFIFLILPLCACTIYQHFIEPYFQYHPLRSFWPAVAMLIFYLYYKSKGKLRYYLLAAVCSSLCLFWNMESGVAITGTFGFCFAVETLSVRFRRDKLIHLAWFCAAFAISILLLYGAYCWSFGRIFPPNYFWQGHQMYLKTGFWALPIPLEVCMWVFFAGIYVAAVIAGLRGVFSGRVTLFSHSCLFIGVLGIGLFSYYQSRSHICTLSAPVWPAVMLMFFFADRCIRMSKSDRKLIALVLPALPIILLGVGALFNLGYNSNFILKGTILQLSFLTVDDSKSQFQQRIDFIRHSAGTRKKVNIVGDYQGIYYAESGLTSGITNFNQQEIYTIKQNEHYAKLLSESDCPLILGPRGDRFYYIQPEILKYYKLMAQSEDGELKYYEPLKNLQKNKLEYTDPAKPAPCPMFLFEDIK